LSPRRLGAKAGTEQETLVVNTLPSHGHGPIRATADSATQRGPGGQILASTASQDIYRDDEIDTSLSSSAVTNVGGSGPHTNLMPTLCVNFIIALFGIYPSRQ
jgi:microcystin-dependent protein